MISAQKAQRVVGKWTFFVFTSDKTLDVVTAGFLLAIASQSYAWPCCKYQGILLLAVLGFLTMHCSFKKFVMHSQLHVLEALCTT